MADQYGVGAGLQTALQVFVTAGRQTGKTTRMLDALKPGDRIVAKTQQSAQHLRHLLLERGIADVEVVAFDPEQCVSSWREILKLGTSQGQTYFDHTWVEAYWQIVLARQAADISKMSTELSGYSEAHRRTARQAEAYQRLHTPVERFWCVAPDPNKST